MRKNTYFHLCMNERIEALEKLIDLLRVANHCMVKIGRGAKSLASWTGNHSIIIS